MHVLDSSLKYMSLSVAAATALPLQGMSHWRDEGLSGGELARGPVAFDVPTDPALEAVIVPAPASSSIRRYLAEFWVRNRNDEAADLLLWYFDGSDWWAVWYATLQPGHTLHWKEGEGYTTLGTGGERMQTGVAGSMAGGVAAGSVSYSTETPSGAVNGANVTFTVANSPTAGSFMLFQNGMKLRGGGNDFTLSGTTITFVTAPSNGDFLEAVYAY